MDDLVTHLPQLWIVLTGLGLVALGFVVHRDLENRTEDEGASPVQPSSGQRIERI